MGFIFPVLGLLCNLGQISSSLWHQYSKVAEWDDLLESSSHDGLGCDSVLLSVSLKPLALWESLDGRGHRAASESRPTIH
jgi:hypothetical protein